jgi:hypothetical protein
LVRIVKLCPRWRVFSSRSTVAACPDNMLRRISECLERRETSFEPIPSSADDRPRTVASVLPTKSRAPSSASLPRSAISLRTVPCKAETGQWVSLQPTTHQPSVFSFQLDPRLSVQTASVPLAYCWRLEIKQPQVWRQCEEPCHHERPRRRSPASWDLFTCKP